MQKISVIIPVYNTEKHLDKCLDSVCNQTLSDIEIICINDCSTDNFIDVLNKYSIQDKRIKIVNFKNHQGVSSARNRGLDEAKGKYINLIDSDDFIDSDFYEKLYNKARVSKSNIIKGMCKNIAFDGTKNYDFEYHMSLADFPENFYSWFTTAIYNKSFLK